MSTEKTVPSIRLTNADRSKIERAAISARFDPIDAALKKEEDRIGRRCYEVVIPPADRKHVAALPEHWFPTQRTLRFNVGGLNVQFVLSGCDVRVPHQDWHGRLGTITEGGPLYNEVLAHLKAVEKAKKDRDETAAVLRSLLASVSNLKALQALWPEGEPYWRPIAMRAGAPSPGLPAPLVSEINEMLGLKGVAA